MFSEYEAVVIVAFFVAGMTSAELPYLSLIYLLAVTNGVTGIPGFAVVTMLYLGIRYYVHFVRAVR